MRKEFQYMGIGCLGFLVMLVISAVFALFFFLPELLIWIVPAGDGMKMGSAVLWIIGGAVALIGSWVFLFSGSMFGKHDEPKRGPDEDAIRCLQCRAVIPREAQECPKCGWKWTKWK